MSAGLVAVLLGGGIPLAAALLLMTIGALGRRARAGRVTGRSTSRPGNPSDNSPSRTGAN
ncbi:hypothetical protein [Micromonospora parva]|uniref:hypothetical protein n=1 Tax=Micromonospora parva TaxID=1464048 RepID=UPI003660EBFA